MTTGSENKNTAKTFKLLAKKNYYINNFFHQIIIGLSSVLFQSTRILLLFLVVSIYDGFHIV